MKKIILIVLLIAMTGLLTACGNRAIIDTTWNFNQAMIKMPDGNIISGSLTNWRDYSESDMIQVTINGITYLTHSANVVISTR